MFKQKQRHLQPVSLKRDEDKFFLGPFDGSENASSNQNIYSATRVTQDEEFGLPTGPGQSLNSSLVSAAPNTSRKQVSENQPGHENFNVRDTFGKNTHTYSGEYQEPHFGSTSQDFSATAYTYECSSPSGHTSPRRMVAQSSGSTLQRGALETATAEQHQENMQDFKMFLQRSKANLAAETTINNSSLVEDAGAANTTIPIQVVGKSFSQGMMLSQHDQAIASLQVQYKEQLDKANAHAKKYKGHINTLAGVCKNQQEMMIKQNDVVLQLQSKLEKRDKNLLEKEAKSALSDQIFKGYLAALKRQVQEAAAAPGKEGRKCNLDQDEQPARAAKKTKLKLQHLEMPEIFPMTAKQKLEEDQKNAISKLIQCEISKDTIKSNVNLYDHNEQLLILVQRLVSGNSDLTHALEKQGQDQSKGPSVADVQKKEAERQDLEQEFQKVKKKHDLAKAQLQKGHAEKLKVQKDLDEKEEALQKLSAQFATLNDQHQEVQTSTKNKSVEAQNHLEALKTNIGSLESKLQNEQERGLQNKNEIQNQLQSLQKEHQQLLQTNQRYIMETLELPDTSGKFVAAKTQVKQFEECTDKMKLIKSQLAEKEQRVAEMEQQIVELTKEVEIKANQPDEASIESIEQMKTQIADLTSEVEKTKQSLETQTNDATALIEEQGERIEDLQGENVLIKRLKDDLTQAKEELSSKLEKAYASERSEISRQKNAHEHEYEELEGKQVYLEAAKERIAYELEESKKTNEELLQQIQTFKNQIEQIGAENDGKNNTQMKELNTNNSTLTAQIESLQQEAEKQKEVLASQEKDVEDKEVQIINKQQEVDGHKLEIENHKQEIENHKKELENQKKEIEDKVKEQLQNQKQDQVPGEVNGEAEKELQSIHEELGDVLGHDVKDKVINMKSQLEQKDQKLANSLEQIRSLNAEFFKVSDQLKQKAAFGDSDDDVSVEGLKDKIEDLNKALRSKDDKLAKYREQYDELREKNKELQKQIKRLRNGSGASAMSLSAAGLSGAVDDQYASNTSKATVMMRRPNQSSDFESNGTEMMKGSAQKGNSQERLAKGDLLSPGQAATYNSAASPNKQSSSKQGMSNGTRVERGANESFGSFGSSSLNHGNGSQKDSDDGESRMIRLDRRREIEIDKGSHAGSSSVESQPSLSDSEHGKKKKLGQNSLIKQQLEALKQFGAQPSKKLNGSTIEERADENGSSRPSEYATEKSSSDWGDGPAASDQDAGSVASFNRRRSTRKRSQKSAKNLESSHQLALPDGAEASATGKRAEGQKSPSSQDKTKDLGVVDIAVDLPSKTQAKQQQPAASAKLGHPEATSGSKGAEAQKAWPKNSARLDAAADGSGSDGQPASSGDEDSDHDRSRVSKASKKSDDSGW